jgi:hypothetical protein
MRAILEQGRRDGEVKGRGYLQGPVIAGDNAHVPAGLLDQPCIVGGGGGGGGDRCPSVLVSMLEHLTKKSLRGLYAA